MSRSLPSLLEVHNVLAILNNKYSNYNMPHSKYFSWNMLSTDLILLFNRNGLGY